MCSQRIDLAYSRLSINEKQDPQDRFIQALDELAITGDAREYFNSKFSTILNEWFFSIDNAEKALLASQPYPLLKDKVAIFLKNGYPTKTINRDIDLYCKGLDISVEQQKKIELLIELAKSFYPDSAYALYNSEFGKIFSMSFSKLSSLIYGEQYCFSKECFNDPSLNRLEENDRTEFLWSVFNDISNNQIIANRIHYAPNNNESNQLFTDYINSDKNLSSNKKTDVHFNNAFSFLKAWIANDALNARPFEILVSITKEISNYFYSKLYCTDQKTDELVASWNSDFELKIQWILLKNFDLSKATEKESEAWTKEAEKYFLIIRNEIETEEHSSFIQQREIRFNNLIKDLSSDSIKHWIKNNIKQDLKSLLEENFATHTLLQSKWCHDKTYEIWKNEFQIQLNQLSIPDQINALSIGHPYWERKDTGFSENQDISIKRFTWWNNLFLEIPKHEMFLKSYLPNWTILAKNKIKTAELLPYLDQSIGILRGELFCENANFDNKDALLVLVELLTSLDRENPDKALRHRLLLFRSSTVPLCDDALNYRTKADDCLWYLPFKDLELAFTNRYSNLGDKLITFYQALSQQISEFCLSRLQLRKKEKVTNGKYLSNQVVEVSPTWRQGYLKAISEIGLDLNGKAHKAAHFIKQADEDENVRAIAAEVYKSVRRKDNSNPSVSELKRGIIAAEWWLLHCQRQELDLEINYDEALKTRRRLLRNP